MFLKLGVILLAFGVSLFAVAGIVIQQTGLLIVDVQDRDWHVFLPIPMLLVNTALAFAPVADQIKVPHEINRHSELIQTAANELMLCPDGPFVEVKSPTDQVLVSKKGANIIVDVQSNDEKIYIQVPIKATGKTMAKLTNLKSDAESEREFRIIRKD
jgi:hypothetical protein